MQIIESLITLDVYDYDYTPTKIKTIQLDSETRFVDAIIQYKGQTYDIGQDATVTLTVIRPDRTGVQITGETKAHVESSSEGAAVTTYGAYAEFTPTSLAVKGTLKCQFMITSGDQVLRTEIFTVANGEALDASTNTWAGEYQGYNLDELVQNVNSAMETVSEMEEDVESVKSGLNADVAYIKKSGRIFTDDVKSALFTLLDKVVYIDGNAQDYIDALHNALNPQARLMSITAVFNQGDNIITNQDDLDTLRQYLTVTGFYVSDDGSFYDEVTTYTLTGALTVGTSTITVTANGLTTTFSVDVTQWTPYTQYAKLIVTGAEYIATGLSEVDLDGCRYEYKVTPQNTGGSSGHILSTAQNYIPFPQPYTTSLIRRIFTVNRGKASNSANGVNVWEVGEDLTFVVNFADDQNAVVVNDITRIASAPVGTQEPSASNQYVMFGYGGAVGTAYYRFIGVFYYLKIYDSNNDLIHHFVPAYDNTNHVAGVYDLVAETFKSSATSTDFTVE